MKIIYVEKDEPSGRHDFEIEKTYWFKPKRRLKLRILSKNKIQPNEKGLKQIAKDVLDREMDWRPVDSQKGYSFFVPLKAPTCNVFIKELD